MFHVLNAAISPQKVSKSRLALYVRLVAHIFSVEHQQSFKVSHTISVEPDNFSVKNGSALYSPPRRSSYRTVRELRDMPRMYGR